MLRLEEIEKATLNYEASLRQQTELARVTAETNGRILAERQNRDLRLEKVGYITDYTPSSLNRVDIPI